MAPKKLPAPPQLPDSEAPAALVVARARGTRCGQCRSCSNPKWKKACLQLASASAAPPAKRARRHSECVSFASVASLDLQDLAKFLDTDLAGIQGMQIRCKSGQYVLLDVALAVTGKPKKDCKKLLANAIQTYTDFAQRLSTLDEPDGEVLRTADICGVVEMVMLLPGKMDASVRPEAARTLVRCLGGDLALAEQVIANRMRPDVLRVDGPDDAARAVGDVEEAAPKKEPGDLNSVAQAFSGMSEASYKKEPGIPDNADQSFDGIVESVLEDLAGRAPAGLSGSS